MYYLIEENSDARYQSLPKQLADEEYIAVDTEFERYHTYFPKPSLLQIASSSETYILDLTKITDHIPLKAIFENSKLLKILHSGYQDFEILLRLAINPINLFDSQVAMSFINLHTKQSFEVLVAEMLGQSIDKSQQNSNWMRRPLKSEQLDYAAKDVILLRACYLKLANTLSSKYANCIEDCRNLLYNPNNFRVNYVKQFSQFAYALGKMENKILAYHLVCYREDRAIEKDITRQRIMSDDLLLEMARSKHIPADAKAYIASASDDDAKDAIKLLESRHIPYGAKDDPRLAVLQQELKKAAAKLDIPAGLIASKKDLLRYLYGIPCKLNKGWRAELSFVKEAAQLAGSEY